MKKLSRNTKLKLLFFCLLILFVASGLYLISRPKKVLSPKIDMPPQTLDQTIKKGNAFGSLYKSGKDFSVSNLCPESVYFNEISGKKYALTLKDSEGNYRLLNDSDFIDKKVEIEYDGPLDRATCEALSCDCENKIRANIVKLSK